MGDEPVKSRWFVLTDWNLNDESDYSRIMGNKSIQFMAFGRETCETTGRLHNQAFFYFKNARSTKKKSLGKMAKWWGETHCHIDAMHGNLQQNEKYCSKEGKYAEIGEKPSQGARSDLLAIKEEIADGKSVDDICMEDPHLFHQYGRTLERIEVITLRKKFRTEMTKGFWYYGPTSVGKSHTSFRDYSPETHYVKDLCEDFWDGYKGQETVIFNEFRGQIALGQLLDLVDKWPKTVKWKCKAGVPFLAKKLIVTSCKHPCEIYKNVLDDDENIAQLERRFQIKELTQKYSEGNIRNL